MVRFVDTLMKPKDIFGLGVRLLGLYFLYSGLNDFALDLASDIFESPIAKDIVYALLPVVFKLIIAVWLLSGWLLVRFAYPEKSKVYEYVPQQPKPAAPVQEPAAAPEPAGLDSAEKKLAALVEKPKEK